MQYYALCTIKLCSSRLWPTFMQETTKLASRALNSSMSCLMAYNTIQYNTIQYNTIQYNTIQHNTTQHNTTQHNTTQHNTTEQNRTEQNRTEQNRTEQNRTQHNTTQHNTTQHNTTQHNTTQHNTTQYNTILSLLSASLIISKFQVILTHKTDMVTCKKDLVKTLDTYLSETGSC